MARLCRALFFENKVSLGNVVTDHTNKGSGQATKSAWRMPWRPEPTKDVAKLRKASGSR